MRFPFIPLLLLVGCTPTPANFLAKSSEIGCSRYEECEKASFEDAYTDHGDCVEETLDDYQDYYDCLAEECDFDPKDATDCLAAVRADDCDDLFNNGEFADSCDITDIYECSDDDWFQCADELF